MVDPTWLTQNAHAAMTRSRFIISLNGTASRRLALAPRPWRLHSSLPLPARVVPPGRDYDSASVDCHTSVDEAFLRVSHGTGSRWRTKQLARSPFQKFLVELLHFLSIELWWRVRLFAFGAGTVATLGDVEVLGCSRRTFGCPSSR
jgi:hypothetical protein